MTTKEITQPEFFLKCEYLRQSYPDNTLEVGHWEAFSGNGEIIFHVLARQAGHRIPVCSCSLNQPDGGAICARVFHILKDWLVVFNVGGAA